jgi:anti-anti-sigma regulatory factor
MINAQIQLMNFEIYKISYFKAIAFSGIMDESLTPQLRELCLKMLKDEKKEFILDLSRVIKISKKVLALFSDVAKKLRLLDGHLLIMNMNVHVFETMREALNLDPNLKFFANELEATKFIEGNRPCYCF